MRTFVEKYLLKIIVLVAFVELIINGAAVSLFGVAQLEERFRPVSRQSFDSSKWNSARFESGDRYRMVDSLLDGDHLLGLASGDVVTLVGKTDLVFKDPKGSPLVFTYLLASQERIPAWSWWLPIVYLGNSESWCLQVRFENSRCVTANVDVGG